MAIFKRTRTFIAISFLAVVLAFGCAPAPRAPLELPPGLEDVLMLRLQENAGAFHSLQGFARVWVRSEGRSAGGRQVLLVREPDLFRAEVLSPFGQPVMQVAADGLDLTALVPGDGVFYLGGATYGNIQRFTRIPLRLEDMVALILYRIPFDAASEREVTPRADGYLLTLRGGQGARQELLFDPQHRLVSAAWFQGERLLLKAEYANFLNTKPPFPQSLALSVPDQEVEGRIDFTEIELNVDIPEERFRLNPPGGYRVEPLP